MFMRNTILFRLVLTAIVLAVFIIGTLAEVKAKVGGQILTTEEIERLTIDYMIDTLPWDPDQAEITVKYNNRDLKLPEGERTLRFVNPGKRKTLGRIPLTLKIRVGEEYHRMVRLSAYVEVYQNVVKVRDSLVRGHILTPGDVELTQVKTSRLIPGVITKIENTVGYEIRRNLNMGHVLRANDLKKPYLIKRGDRILLLASKGSLKITVPGIAKSKGLKGGVIPVENIQTKKVVYGEVIDANTVRVEF